MADMLTTMLNGMFKEQLVDQAKVHDYRECAGLPLCVACRTALLLKNDLDIKKTEAEIETIPVGNKIYY